MFLIPVSVSVSLSVILTLLVFRAVSHVWHNSDLHCIIDGGDVILSKTLINSGILQLQLSDEEFP